MSYTSDDHFPQEDYPDTNPGLDPVDEDLDSGSVEERYFESFDLISNEVHFEEEISPLQALRIRLGLECPLDEHRLSIDALLADLFSPRWTTRVAAIRMLEVLGKQSPPSVIRALVNALDDSSAFVRAAAAQAIGRVGIPSVRAKLTLGIRDRDWRVRASVVQALANLETDVPVETLVGLIGVNGDPDPAVRAAAVSGLGRLDRPDLLETLAKALKDDNLSVRLAAIQALKGRSRLLPVDVLLSAFNDEDEHVRLEMLKVFGQIAPVDVLFGALEDSNEDIRLTALSLLGKKDEQAPLERLLLALKDQSELVRTEVVKLLGRFADQIVKRISSEFLASLLHDETAQLRAVAIWVLGERQDRSARHSLLAAVNDQDETVRSAAIWALQSLGENSVWTSSLEENQFFPRTRRTRLCESLDSQASMQRLLAAMMQYLENKRGYVHPELKETSSGRALVLRCYYQSEGNSLKETVLSEIGNSASVAQLDAALNSGDDLVREVTSQIVEDLALESRPWHELFIASLNLSGNANTQLHENLPTRVVFCSASVQRVRATDTSVLNQIRTLLERPFTGTSVTSSGIDVWEEQERLPNAWFNLTLGKEVLNCSRMADLKTLPEDFQVWYGSPALQQTSSQNSFKWRDARHVSFYTS